MSFADMAYYDKLDRDAIRGYTDNDALRDYPELVVERDALLAEHDAFALAIGSSMAPVARRRHEQAHFDADVIVRRIRSAHDRAAAREQVKPWATRD